MYTPTWHENSYVITGSSGSGKSEVCKILAELGAEVVSADQLAKEVLNSNSKALSEVRATFGDKVFSNGVLDRKALGEIIFNDPKKREVLENITHPLIGELAATKFTELIEGGAKLLVYDCPLYFETKLREQKFKGIILVTAADDLKIARLIQRDQISASAARKRLANQLSDEERAPLADFVIKNDGSLESLREQVIKLGQNFLSV